MTKKSTKLEEIQGIFKENYTNFKNIETNTKLIK